MLDTVSRSGAQLQTVPGGTGVPSDLAGIAPQPLDAAQVAAAVARYRAYQGLREFRARLYGCLTARPDAAFELCDAILCAGHAVTSLAELSLAPQFRRGHGARYDALAAGRIDEEKLAALLTGTLPRLVDGDQGQAWVAEHDKIDYGLLERALAGVPAGAAGQVRDACARWARLRFAIDATPYPRPDAECSPGRPDGSGAVFQTSGAAWAPPHVLLNPPGPARAGPKAPSAVRHPATQYRRNRQQGRNRHASQR